MSCVFTLEKVLDDAKSLVSRLKEQESTADGLLSQTQDLGKKVESMKLYQENLSALSELAKQRPQAELTVGLFQESSEISQLQHENDELRQALDEHQAAIELIMSRYRSHVSKLVAANRRERSQFTTTATQSQQAQEKIQRIHKMAGVMWSAITADTQSTADTEYAAQLQLENATLRELLTAGRHSLESPVCSQAAQTDVVPAEDSDVDVSVGSPRSDNADLSSCSTATSVLLQTARTRPDISHDTSSCSSAADSSSAATSAVDATSSASAADDDPT